jgi:hypothetical protein
MMTRWKSVYTDRSFDAEIDLVENKLATGAVVTLVLLADELE